MLCYVVLCYVMLCYVMLSLPLLLLQGAFTSQPPGSRRYLDPEHTFLPLSLLCIDFFIYLILMYLFLFALFLNAVYRLPVGNSLFWYLVFIYHGVTRNAYYISRWYFPFTLPRFPTASRNILRVRPVVRGSNILIILVKGLCIRPSSRSHCGLVLA